jgi:hypothetical protein
MQYLNIPTAFLRSPEYIAAEPTARATWLSLIGYCAEQENGGIIAACAAWKDRQWQQTAGVTLEETKMICSLWKWEGDSIILFGYPSDKEAMVRSKRQAGTQGGRAKTQAKTQAARQNGAKHNPSKHPSTTQAQPKQTPNGKERKGKEGKEKEDEEAASAASKNSFILSDPETNTANTADIANTANTADIAKCERLVEAYPRRTHYADALREARACLQRNHGDAETILAGIHAIAKKVAGWTESERLTFLKKPHLFFAGDHWRDDPEYWRGKNDRAPAELLPDLGGRAPAETFHL